MASVAPSLPSRERVTHYGKLAIGVIFSAIIGGLIAGWFTYVFTAKLNTEAALQHQYLSAVQEFVSTGSEVDASVTNLADSILDGQEVRTARQASRLAIANHVAATVSLSQVIGEGNANLYMEGLASMRTYVDAANSSQSALAMSNARFDLMENRNAIVHEAQRRIYEDT